jgi:hypothetical protein
MVALFLNNPTILNKVSGKTLVLRETFDLRRDFSGADPGFQVGGGGGGGGAHLKKLHRAEGGVKTFGVFRVKNHDFTPINHICFLF